MGCGMSRSRHEPPPYNWPHLQTYQANQIPTPSLWANLPTPVHTAGQTRQPPDRPYTLDGHVFPFTEAQLRAMEQTGFQFSAEQQRAILQSLEDQDKAMRRAQRKAMERAMKQARNDRTYRGRRGYGYGRSDGSGGGGGGSYGGDGGGCGGDGGGGGGGGGGGE